MASDFQDYTPTDRFTNVQTLLPNHFRFVIDALPDLSFFAQTVSLPDIVSTSVKQATPFTTVPQVGDHLEFGALTVFYLIDAAFKSYFSLFYWLKGYGFPTSYDDVTNFMTSRKRALGNPKPTPRDMFTTTATLMILSPDTDSAIAEVQFSDVFPTALGAIQFETNDHDINPLRSQVTFAYTDFNVRLTNRS